MDEPTIAQIFRNDERLRKKFTEFFRRGAKGWLLTDGERWVTYGWVTRLDQFRPDQIGFNLAKPADWIFYCGTHPDYRGRGAFQTLLRRMAREQIEDSSRELFVDNVPANIASRRAVEKVGFIPNGMLRSIFFRIPGRPLVFTFWNRSQPHPK